MAYDREKLEKMIDNIPKGKVTRHGLLAKALGTTPRAVAPAVCASKGKGQLRVVKKGGWLPHPYDDADRLMRARFLKAEGLKISSDNRRVIVNEHDMWAP